MGDTDRPAGGPKLSPADLAAADALAVRHRLPYRDRPPCDGWRERAKEELEATHAGRKRDEGDPPD